MNLLSRLNNMLPTQLTLFEEPETINHIAESYTGIYSTHKYWSKNHLTS